MPMQSVLTLGRQESALDAPCCRYLQATYGAPVEGLEWEKEPYAETFFHRLGAERVDSLDRSAYQSSTLCRDLNDPPPPTTEEGYDLVYDGGTLEHVFHFPNAIANCMSLVKVGGHFMASVPANQWHGHGFYQFSPELFFRVLSPENGFEIVRIYLAENAVFPGRIFRVMDPNETGVRALFSSPKPLLLLVWAKRIAAVTPFAQWPQQSDYSARWEKGKEQAISAPKVRTGALAGVRRLVGKLVPFSVKYWLAWRKHFKASMRGMVQLDKLQ
ncbi:MAG: class I SAM-dependent methyltransferase [Prosthecobacter sp.]